MLPRCTASVLPFMPWSTSSLTRPTVDSIDVSVLSAMPSQLRPSPALRWNWSLRRMSERYCIASTVWMGESDGRLSDLPLDSCTSSLAIFDRFSARLSVATCMVLPGVTRIVMVLLPADQAGVVDEAIEHL